MKDDVISPEELELRGLRVTVEKQEQELAQLRRRLPSSDICHCPGFCEWHKRERFEELTKDNSALAGLLQAEIDRINIPCADALDFLWRKLFDKQYGYWEYPGQAARHIAYEVRDLRDTLKRLYQGNWFFHTKDEPSTTTYLEDCYETAVTKEAFERIKGLVERGERVNAENEDAVREGGGSGGGGPGDGSPDRDAEGETRPDGSGPGEAGGGASGAGGTFRTDLRRITRPGGGASGDEGGLTLAGAVAEGLTKIDEIFDGKGKLNCYRCEECPSVWVTIDRDTGVTPFLISCRKEGCAGMCQSGCYNDAFQPENGFLLPPMMEWYRPDPDSGEEFDQFQLEHISNGGLILREVSDGIDP